MRGGFKAEKLSSEAHWHSQLVPGLLLTKLEEWLLLCSSSLLNSWYLLLKTFPWSYRLLARNEMLPAQHTFWPEHSFKRRFIRIWILQGRIPLPWWLQNRGENYNFKRAVMIPAHFFETEVVCTCPWEQIQLPNRSTCGGQGFSCIPFPQQIYRGWCEMKPLPLVMDTLAAGMLFCLFT